MSLMSLVNVLLAGACHTSVILRLRQQAGTPWKAKPLLQIGLLLAAFFFLSSCSSTYQAKRDQGLKGDNPRKQYLLHQPHYSLGFIEFDEQGEACSVPLAREVLRDLQNRSRNAKAQGRHLVVFVYVHGWENHAQSADVGRFEQFLEAASRWRGTQQYDAEIYGVYVAWQGRGLFDPRATALGRVFDDTFLALPKVLSFWTREQAAARVARVSGTEALLWIANAAKTPDPTGAKVIVMGHSFGARVVEEALDQAYQALMLDPRTAGKEVSAPVDLVVLLNEATDALQTKRMQELFAHSSRYGGATVNSDKPLFVSLTSEADSATRVWFRVARFMETIVSVNRPYRETPSVTQHTFTRQTAGHIDFLKTHEILPRSTLATEQPLMSDSWSFSSDNNGTQDDPTQWSIKRTIPAVHTPYWVVKCEKEFINDHGDVWNPKVRGFIFALLRRNQTLDPNVQTTVKALQVSDFR